MKFWIENTNIDGFRVDAVRYLVEKHGDSKILLIFKILVRVKEI
jgi:1,4-alpha-glucan branching enzyme